MTLYENKPASSTFVSVIIPVFNDTDRLESCLEALRTQTHQDFEILIIDNGSTVPGLDVLCAQFENVKLLCEQKPGSYAARNKGLREAKGDVIAFTDADCIPEVNWLEMGIKRLLSTPNCGLVAGRIKVFPREVNTPTNAELYEMRWAFPQKTWVETEKFAATANMFTFRTVINIVGTFNGDLKSGGDREWGNRVAEQGYVVLYDDEVCISHPARRNLKELRSKVRRSTSGRRDINNSWGSGILLLLKYLKPPVKLLLQTFHNDHRSLSWVQKLQVCYVIVALRVTLVTEVIRLWWGNAPSTRA